MRLRILLLPLFLLFGQHPDWRAVTNMNGITDLVSDNEQVWAATEGGVYRYEITNGVTTPFTTVDGLRGVNITALTQAPDGGVLTGSGAGVIQQITSNGIISDVYQFDDIPIDRLFRNGDDIWVAAGNGLAVFRYQNNRYLFFDYYQNFPVTIDEIRDIALFAGKVYLATDNGLLSAPADYGSHTLNDPAQWSHKGTSDGLPSSRLTRLSVFNNRLWIGTEDGIATLSTSAAITPVSEYAQHTINALTTRDDTLYIASGSVLYHSVADNPRLASANHGHTIQSLSHNGNRLWIGFQSFGLQSRDGSVKVVLDGIYHNPMRVIVRDHNQNTWALAQKYKFHRPNSGLYTNKDGAWRYYTFTGEKQQSIWKRLNSLVSAYVDRFNNVWLGSWGGGLMVYHNNAFEYFHDYEDNGTLYERTVTTTETQPLQSPPEDHRGYFSGANNSVEDYEVITAFTEDAYGRLWIANAYAQNGNYLAVAPYDDNTGFIVTDKSSWHYFGRQDGISLADDKGIPALAADDFGRIWIATHDQGLYIFDYNNTLDDRSDDVYFKRSIDDNIAGTEVRSLAVDKDGVVWIGTTAGLSSFDGLNFYRHPGDGINGTEGPVGNEISQIVVDNYNNKWVCTSEGLSVLRGERSVFEPNAWVSFTTANSGLLDNNVHGVAVDAQSGEAWIATESGISVYSGAFAEARPDYNSVSAGPNPFIVDGTTRHFIIRRLKNNSTVKILTINGKLVRELQSGSVDIDGGRAQWDGRDSRGQVVRSGVYLYHAYTIDGSATTGKIAVIHP